MTQGLRQAVDALSTAHQILIFTGAGISTESGIPDFRGPDGLWKRVDPDDFTITRYVANRDVRVRSWSMHRNGELWGARSTVRPNAAHHAVTDLWRTGRVVGVITQNIDGLHLEAGLPPSTVSEIHGNVRRCACLGCAATWPTEEVLGWVDGGEEDPHCPSCRGLVKTTTVMFGELLPDSEILKAEAFVGMADAVLVIGSTLSVYPAADFALRVADHGYPMVIVNQGPTDHDRRAAVKLEGPAGTVLPELVANLG